MPNIIESQVVKIQLGDNKKSTSFIYLLAENIESTNSEVYMLMEIPLFNPAGASECERIAKALSASLRRNYKDETNAQDFENNLESLNKEIEKLHSWGLTNWQDKLNCAVVVKNQNSIWVTSTGKITVLLLRDGEFINLGDSNSAGSEANKFESYVDGKIKINDLFLLATNDTFEYITINELKNKLQKLPLMDAAGQISDILQSSLGPEKASGIILSLQAEAEAPVAIQSKPPFNPPQLLSKVSDLKPKIPTISLQKLSVSEISSFFRLLYTKIRPEALLQKFKKPAAITEKFEQVASPTGLFSGGNPFPTRTWTKKKIIIIVSAILLLCLLFVNLYLSKQKKQEVTKQETISTEVKTIEDKLTEAEKQISFNPDAAVFTIFDEIKAALNSLKQTENKDEAQVTALEDRFGKLVAARNKKIAATITLAGDIDFEAKQLTKAGNDLLIIGDNKQAKAYSNNELKNFEWCSTDTVKAIGEIAPNKVAVYTGSNLVTCDTTTKEINNNFTQIVPASHELGGITYYPDVQRIYLVNKSTSKIVTLETTGEVLTSRDWASDTGLATASNMTIDGAIYVYTSAGISKFASGAKTTFSQPSVYGDISFTPKLFTTNKLSNLFILDGANSRIIITNKTGTLVSTIESTELKDAEDILVENNKTIYVLSKNKLYKITY